MNENERTSVGAGGGDMERTPSGWTIIDRDAAVLSFEYAFDGRGSTTNSFVARMGNGKLLVISPPYRTPEAAFEDLAEFGEVGAVVANNGFHHLGQPEWRERFPNARFFAPAESAARIAKKNPAAPAFEPLDELAELLGDDVSVTAAPGTKIGESWARAKIAGGNAWYVSDILVNMQRIEGPLPVRVLWKWTKSGPGYRVFHLTLKFTVKDKKQVLGRLAEEMRLNPPTVIVPSHGTLLRHAGLAEETQELIAAAL